MSLFLAAASAFLILARVLAHRLRTADPYGLREARRAASGRVWADVQADRLEHRDRLRVPHSFLSREEIAAGRERLEEFHREDR
jgi:hypothetical protein